MFGFGSIPACRICDATRLSLTCFESNGSAGFHDKVFSARPNSHVAYLHEIEFGDYDPTGKVGFFTSKSLSRTGRARHRASSSTGHGTDGW